MTALRGSTRIRYAVHCYLFARTQPERMQRDSDRRLRWKSPVRVGAIEHRPVVHRRPGFVQQGISGGLVPPGHWCFAFFAAAYPLLRWSLDTQPETDC